MASALLYIPPIPTLVLASVAPHRAKMPTTTATEPTKEQEDQRE